MGVVGAAIQPARTLQVHTIAMGHANGKSGAIVQPLSKCVHIHQLSSLNHQLHRYQENLFQSAGAHPMLHRALSILLHRAVPRDPLQG